MGLYDNIEKTLSNEQVNAIAVCANYVLRIVLLDRSIKAGNTNEMPYGSMLDDDCDVVATLKMWRSRKPIEDMDATLSGLKILKKEDINKIFSSIFDRLKECCEKPQENISELCEINDLKWQFDFTKEPYNFKLAPNVCNEILDQCVATLTARVETILGSGTQKDANTSTGETKPRQAGED